MKGYIKISILVLLAVSTLVFATIHDGPVLKISSVSRSPQKAPASGDDKALMEIYGTGNSETFVVSGKGLLTDIQLSATAGISVSPTTIPAGSGDVTVTVTNNTTLKKNAAKVIMRSADEREYVYVTTYGTELERKDLSQNPVYSGGSDESMTFDGFNPGENGYTIEFKAKIDKADMNFYPFAVSDDGVGFKAYVDCNGMGLFSADTKKGLSNPSNGGTFYNTDGLYHTYRYSVTSDKRVIIFRDGILVDTLRTADYALSKDFTYENGDVEENLVKNPNFEGEYNYSSSRGIVTHIEGWEVTPWDQWNSTQNIVREERNNEVDMNNHVLTQDRYMWEAGYAAGEVAQVVNVAPNEVYSFSALAKGGIKSNGNQLGSLRIQDMQNSDNKVVIPVTSENWQTYATDFETMANTKQIRLVCYIERDAWGASISELRTDNVKLTGVSRKVLKTIGFNNESADIAYFTFDNSGAYAPLVSAITTNVDTLYINGTNRNADFTVDGENLISDIEVTTSSGITAWPTTIKAGNGPTKVRVVNLTSLDSSEEKVILRSADQRKYVIVKATGTPLEQKDISANPVYAGGNDDAMSFTGFEPGENGFTLEFKVKTDNPNKQFFPYAVTEKGVGFKGYVDSNSMGLYNSTSKHGLSNPANGGTFYNTDGLFHTYRYAVSADKRIRIYRDGALIQTLRTQDFALQPEWSTETGAASRNLLKNGNFEGEWNFSSSRNITNYIEGFQVTPWDQYNSYQNIVSEERNNDVDMNNHVLEMHRYKWEAGYSAGEVSQIVDVAPNEVYSFSALAKGGIKSDGTQLGSLRIQDLQNSDNKAVLTVNSDSYKTYSCDFETKANTHQIRVACYLERDKWGASISGLMVDDMKLSGYSRVVTPQIGFSNDLSDIEYFTFDNTGAYAPLTTAITTSLDSLTISGTGTTETFKVNTSNLISDVTVSATHGLEVMPKVITAGSGEVEVKVTNTTTLRKNVGKVILRSADIRKYVFVETRGSVLEQKDLSQDPIFKGDDQEMVFLDFNPGENGYTIEFKVKTDDATKQFFPYAVSAAGVGFKGYVESNGIGLYNSENKKSLSNPANGGTFYNTDGLFHTYRYAVTCDKRVIVYRDGLMIDTLRTADMALPRDLLTENGDIVENLLINPGFEGEYDFSSSRNIVTHIEGWDVDPWDQYNSTQNIVTEERNNEVDQNNHVLTVSRYKWSDGWGAAQISQVVNVAPNEVYSFSSLAKGGIKSDGTKLGSIRLQDMQNNDNKQIIQLSSDSWQTYATDFETQANTRQMRVTFYLERDKWGATISALRADDVKLTGVSRLPTQQAGFLNESAELEYFTFDETGAYAPLETAITTSIDSLVIEGTGASKTFKVNTSNLISDVQVSCTHGLEVTPEIIPAGKGEVTVNVTNLTTLRKNVAKVILRSADIRKYVYVETVGSELEEKDLSQNPVYSGGSDESMTFDGFNPGENGYTIEFKAKIDKADMNFYPFAVSDDGVGFKAYVDCNGMGLFSADTKKGLSNPSNGGTFYNTDGLYHTYRYSVTSDKRVIIFRDGILVDTLRTADYALSKDFTYENGDVEENLVKNPNFEGEYNYSSSRGIVTHIEGWEVTPWDQWNSTQNIVREERNNEVDMNNHVLTQDRYMWEAGYAAGEVAQVVNVAPNEVYSFSALAKGGIKSNGNQLGSLRIQDMQNSDNKVVIPVTSENWQTYATDFETMANTKQIRLVCYIERDAWGASISELRTDNVKLTGVSRKVLKTIGFFNEFADIAYFTFDNSGAYAPPITDISVEDISNATDIENLEGKELGWKIYNENLVISNIMGRSTIQLLDINGRLLFTTRNDDKEASIPITDKGIYICVVNDDDGKHVMKIVK